MLRRAVELHGAARLWNAGLDVLGYPANWATSGKEVVRLQQALSVSASVSP